MESGADVISEALVAGSVGLLGPDYAGYYPVSDGAALADLLLRIEREPEYLDRLNAHCAARAVLFRPEREREALGRAIGEVSSGRPLPGQRLPGQSLPGQPLLAS